MSVMHPGFRDHLLHTDQKEEWSGGADSDRQPQPCVSEGQEGGRYRCKRS